MIKKTLEDIFEDWERKMSDNRYQNEIDEFYMNFAQLKNHKVVLYGIGRYTATLLHGVKDFDFVGLMDKDPSNIGKEMFGLPIIDIDTAERTADLIVINTSETYWDVIYDRISATKLPVYFKNGVRAEKKQQILCCNPYQNLSMDDLCRQIEQAQIVSFDFFDTLFMRLVCNPRDVFRLLEYDTQEIWTSKKSFYAVRSEAVQDLKANYCFEELYSKIEELSGMSHDVIQVVQGKEILLEKAMLVPRKEMLLLLQNCIREGKEVYLISDMYLPVKFYMEVLLDYGISLDKKNILISNELHMSKADGSLWNYYSGNIVKGKRALHVGDHEKVDVEYPRQYCISSYLAPNVWKSLETSSLKSIVPYICTTYDSAIMGCILSRLFSNPYALYKSDGRLRIDLNQDMGYLLFGPVILTFLLWIMAQSKKDRVQKLVFMSRDGYFLKQDYEYLCHLMNVQTDCLYLGISRQLAMSASITNKEELMEYIFMPYTGTMAELFEDRFGLENVEEFPNGTVEQYLEKYGLEVKENLSCIRKNYLYYLNQMELDESSAVVDLGYYGNNQRYLNKLLHREMRGYYFNANLSPQNENTVYQQMSACFQQDDDLTGEQSKVRQQMIFLESILTAPYGMVKKIDANGKFVCAEKKQNQLHFHDKEEINEGIQQFIQQYISKFGTYQLEIDPVFIDQYYGCCMNGGFVFDDQVKQSFYNDNAMMNRIESMLFY